MTLPPAFATLQPTPAIRRDGDSWVLDLHVQPGARHTGPMGSYGDRIRFRLAARAVDGEANRALIRWLADHFGVPKSRVHIVRGVRSRRKTVRIGP